MTRSHMTLTSLPACRCSLSHFTDVDAEPQGGSAGLSHLVTENSIKPLQTRVEARLQTELVHRPRGSRPWLWGKPIRSSIPCPPHPTRGPAGGASCALPRSRPRLLALCWGRHPRPPPITPAAPLLASASVRAPRPGAAFCSGNLIHRPPRSRSLHPLRRSSTPEHRPRGGPDLIPRVTPHSRLPLLLQTQCPSSSVLSPPRLFLPQGLCTEMLCLHPHMAVSWSVQPALAPHPG